MHRPKRWNIAPPTTVPRNWPLGSRSRPLIAQMLLNRGYRRAAGLRRLPPAQPKGLHDPASSPTSPGRRPHRPAIRDRQKIVIYGDYDVDGITATAILWHAIRQLGGDVDYYIPHRIEEGYGLNEEALAQICADGAGLIPGSTFPQLRKVFANSWITACWLDIRS